MGHSDVVLDLPLRGEWRAVMTPGYLGAGHEPNPLRRLLATLTGHAYAFDFVKPHSARGISSRADQSATWGQPVYAPGDGRVVAAADGWPDKETIAPVRQLLDLLIRRPKGLDADLRPAAGNYLVVEHQGAFIFLAHFRCGSLRVKTGDVVGTGQPLGEVGHSGTSFTPHLHLQVMDQAEPLKASGVAFSFRQFDRWTGEAWTPAVCENPKRLELFRSAMSDAGRAK